MSIFKPKTSSDSNRHYRAIISSKNSNYIWGKEKRFNLGRLIKSESIQKYFYEKVQEYIDDHDTVLEIGCGTGIFMVRIAPLCQEIVGLDISIDMLLENSNFAKSIQIENVRLVNGSAERLPFADKSFDKIFLIDAIHHIPNISETVNEIRRVIKPEGLVIVFEPNKYNILLWIFCFLDRNEWGALRLGSKRKYKQLFKKHFLFEILEYNGLLIGPDSWLNRNIVEFLNKPIFQPLLGWQLPKIFMVMKPALVSTCNNTDDTCWICNESNLYLIKSSNIPEGNCNSLFRITDPHYGITADLYKCCHCSFIQSTMSKNVIKQYEELEDQQYENTRKERCLQQKKILELITQFKNSGRLLDIGAGSGMLVEEAEKIGFTAEGIEPSRWLQEQAIKRNLNVHLGAYPCHDLNPPYDVITLVDIIEHVPNPLEILSQVRDHLKNDGIGLLITPDASSIFAKLFGMKWWHYRVAHIGYFNKRNLLTALELTGLEPISVLRPSWYFSLEYLYQRLSNYLPKVLMPRLPNKIKDRIISLNLRDSILVIFKRKQ